MKVWVYVEGRSDVRALEALRGDLQEQPEVTITVPADLFALSS